MTGLAVVKRDAAEFAMACQDEHVLTGNLHLASDPQERAQLLFGLSDAYTKMSRTCDAAGFQVPPGQGEGVSRRQVYDDMAILAFDLAGSELCLIGARRAEQFIPRDAGPEERKAWEALHVTWTRAGRADVLSGDLTAWVTARCGTRVSSLLILVAAMERRIGG